MCHDTAQPWQHRTECGCFILLPILFCVTCKEYLSFSAWFHSFAGHHSPKFCFKQEIAPSGQPAGLERPGDMWSIISIATLQRPGLCYNPKKTTWEITRKPKNVIALAVRTNWDCIWTQLSPSDGWECHGREQLKPFKFSRHQANAKTKLFGTDPTCHGWPWAKQQGHNCTGSDSPGIAVDTTKGEPRQAAASLSFCEIFSSNKRLSKESL